MKAKQRSAPRATMVALRCNSAARPWRAQWARCGQRPAPVPGHAGSELVSTPGAVVHDDRERPGTDDAAADRV
jgi:hypothetical protein